MTAYLVLEHRHDSEGKSEGWWFIGNVDASGARAAVKATVKEPGEYAAIPARSWKPTKVTIDTNPTVKFAAT